MTRRGSSARRSGSWHWSEQVDPNAGWSSLRRGLAILVVIVLVVGLLLLLAGNPLRERLADRRPIGPARPDAGPPSIPP